MAKLIMMMGIPGSGKTALAKRIKGKKIHIDECRRALTGTYESKEDDQAVDKMMQYMVAHFLEKKKDVILDGMLLSEEARRPYLRIAKRFGVTVELYWFDLSVETIERQLETRNMSPELAKEWSCSVDIPTYEEGFEHIHYIHDKNVFFY